ncbi:hypothetical protein CHARACLAT_026755 [Characodon lateralis]|uniref:Uncharacterized protein n=1 Tax=Characodon lateralis TaxID=208331 RepID=A0ABU7DK21_9TELE|nr:hypothetical protein [Characodon lateralis]
MGQTHPARGPGQQQVLGAGVPDNAGPLLITLRRKLHLRGHPTRGIPSSTVLHGGMTVEDICTTASWSSLRSFIRVYLWDVSAFSMSYVGVIHFGWATQFDMHSSTDVAALMSTGIIKPTENKLLLPFPVCLKGRSNRGTYLEQQKLPSELFFPPHGHSQKSLKAGILSDARRSDDSYTDRRPRRHSGAGGSPQRFYFQGDSLLIQSTATVPHIFPILDE